MAEAVVEERPQQRFYCHMCNVQFQHAASNFTCPHCSDGFIEELHDTDDTSNDTGTDVEDWEDEEMGEADELVRSIFEERRSPRTRSETNGAGGGLHRTSGGGAGGRRYTNRSRSARPRTLTRLASSNLFQNEPSFENFLQDIILNLGVDSIINLGVGGNWGAAGNMQLVFGNPGDYAWGREGLDAIVTQLLNQMDSTGPPPVSKAVIDALPLAEITDDQVVSKLQCSVCWEDFVAREPVKRLPCQHVYHEPCIRPWLELHGTCPICRQNLGGGGGGSGGDRDGEEGAVGGEGGGGTSSAANALLRSLFGASPTPSTSSSSAADGSGRQRGHNDSMM